MTIEDQVAAILAAVQNPAPVTATVDPAVLAAAMATALQPVMDQLTAIAAQFQPTAAPAPAPAPAAPSA